MFAGCPILASGQDLEVTRLVYRLGDGTDAHVHDREQAGWIGSGRFRLTLGNNVVLLESGSAYVVPAHVTHVFEVLEPGIVDIVTSPTQRTYRTQG
jgi:mannose-6-phosphate isomerase-like protein (cupin superfamily)